MPLHEYLEQKRRQNIDQLNKSESCHICGSNSRNTKGFHHAVNVSEQQGGNYNENSMVRPPNISAMRTCACFGNTSPGSDDYWPYSLRVCERCIQDDIGIGRIRNCGICGMIACDENCGVELLECTDNGECTNLGCIECRKMSDFSEMEIFNSKNIMSQGNMPRMTRVCISCLEQSAPWIRYDFVCRRFHCETKLVQSDIVEFKRTRTFGSSPMNLLPEDGLVNIVSYLCGSDLTNLYTTCSAMCTIAEQVAKDKVESVNNDLLTGPIIITTRKRFGSNKEWIHFEGTNDFGLRAPDDEKSWVGLYHYIKKIIEETYYFGFQMKGEDGDKDIVSRFINMSSEEKFSFGQTFSKVEDNLVPSPTVGLMIRGGTVLVTNPIESPSPVVIASKLQLPSTGITGVICRLFSPAQIVGSIGIICTNQTGDGPSNTWVKRKDIIEPNTREETLIALQYDADEQTLVIHRCSTSPPYQFETNSYNIRFELSSLDNWSLDTPGDLHIGFELASSVLGVKQTLLSVRNCNEDEFVEFTKAHRTESNANNQQVPQLAAVTVRPRVQPLPELIQQAREAGEARDVPLPVQDNGEREPFRVALIDIRRERDAARQALAQPDAPQDPDNNVIPQQAEAQADAVQLDDADNNNNVVMPQQAQIQQPQQQEAAAVNNNNIVPPQRRVVQAVRPQGMNDGIFRRIIQRIRPPNVEVHYDGSILPE